MLEEGVGAGAEVINQALYGGSKSSDLGEALYELKEEKRKSCTYYKEVATFYNDYVVIQNAKQFCCLPMHYEEYIIPKYKLCGAVVSKGVSWFTIVWGFLFLLVGIGLLMNEDLVGVGVGLLFLSFILLLLPMCMSRYYTELQVLDDPDASPTVYNLRTFKKPDDDFIMLYVYGTLHNNTQGYHALAHLIDDSLVSKVRPLEMTGIQIDAAQLPNPPAAPAVPGAAGAINSGYGKQLYALAQTTGLCGDDESSPCAKWGTSCLRNTTRATFCENFIVISTEQKILCCAPPRALTLSGAHAALSLSSPRPCAPCSQTRSATRRWSSPSTRFRSAPSARAARRPAFSSSMLFSVSASSSLSAG